MLIFRQICICPYLTTQLYYVKKKEKSIKGSAVAVERGEENEGSRKNRVAASALQAGRQQRSGNRESWTSFRFTGQKQGCPFGCEGSCLLRHGPCSYRSFVQASLSKYSVLLTEDSTNYNRHQMIQQMGLLYNKVMHGEDNSGQDMKLEAGFKRLFRKFHKQPKAHEILSVYGDKVFHTYLSASIPESAHITRIQHGLRDFRGKQRFDLAFYSHSQHGETGIADILEDLCYCRMLLRPGAFLFLTLSRQRPQHVTGWFIKNRNREVTWLRQTGFANITSQKMGIGFLLVGGQRPAQKF